MASSSTVMANFNPHRQHFNITAKDGSRVSVSLAKITIYFRETTILGIIYGAQLGACVVMLVTVLAIERAEKMRKPLFVLNAAALFINSLRVLFECIFYTGPFNDTYAIFAYDYSEVPNWAFHTQVAAIVFACVALVTAEVSLLLQTELVWVTAKKMHRILLRVASLVVIVVVCGHRISLGILNIKAVLENYNPSGLQGFEKTTSILVMVSIWWFCLLFVGKVMHRWYTRWAMKQPTWGPYEVFTIMGFQTLLVPAIFTIIQFTESLPGADSNVLTVVLLFLPLSAMWASASIYNRSRSSGAGNNQAGSGHGPHAARKPSGTGFTSSSALASPVEDRFMVQASRHNDMAHKNSNGQAIDLELQAFNVRKN